MSSVPQSYLVALLLALGTACERIYEDEDETGPPPTRSLVVESEPNGTPAAADALVLGETVQGRIDARDRDCWRVDLADGQIVSLQVFATRLDQDAWSGNPPTLLVRAPDGVSPCVLRDSLGEPSFGWGVLDPDVPAFRAEEAGAYTLELAADDEERAGGEYLLVVQELGVALALEGEPARARGLNDTLATAEPLATGVLYGYHVDDEDDWFRVQVSEPSLLTFAVLAQRNGPSGGDDDTFDSLLTLYDERGQELAANDDGLFDDSLLEWVCSTGGAYFLRVGECCADGDAPYFLIHERRTLADSFDESEPNDTPSAAPYVTFDRLVQGELSFEDKDVFAVPCLAGDRLELWLYDRARHERARAAVDVVLEDGRGRALAMDAGTALGVRSMRIGIDGTCFLGLSSAAPEGTDYAFELRLEPARFETEPNDEPGTASALDLAGNAAGRMDRPGDVDRFAFEAVAGVPVLLECFADDEFGSQGFDELDGDGSDLDPALEVFDPLGNVRARVDARARTALGVVHGRSTVSVAFVPRLTGTHTLAVRDANGAAGPSYSYSIARH